MFLECFNCKSDLMILPWYGILSRNGDFTIQCCAIQDFKISACFEIFYAVILNFTE